MKQFILATLICLALVSSASALDPGIYDITVQAGEDYVLEIEFTDSTGAPLDVSSHTFKAQARKVPTATTTFANFSTTPIANGVRIWLSRATTARNTNTSGFYDVQETDENGQVSYPLSGKIQIVPTVTR